MKAMIVVSAALLAAGCGVFPFGGDEADDAPSLPTAGSEAGPGPDLASWGDVEPGEDAPTVARPELPQAPWQAEPLAGNDAPEELVAAWSSADNREWCAPIAPGADRGARARPARYSGGWAVEFDKDGMPGMARNGRRCHSCGRGAYGVAGTALMVDDEDIDEAEERGFSDGSLVRIEAAMEEDEGDEPNSRVATVKIRGQGCVYQVWTHAGDEHLEELVSQLRFVQVPRD